jgi:hypothetical protein
MICSDEAYFYLTSPINKHNNRVWSQSQPGVGVEQPLLDQVLVWCAISANKVFGPNFFETCVNQHNYLSMFKDFSWPRVLRTSVYKKHYLEQDGATPQTAYIVQTWLSDKFKSNFI